MKDVNRLAVFDLDGTLLRTDSVLACAIPAIKMKMVNTLDMLRLVSMFLGVRFGLVRHNFMHDAVVAIFKGLKYEEITFRVGALAPVLKRHFAPAIVEVLEEYQMRHYITAIATAGAEPFAQVIGDMLGVDKVVGTRLAWRDGVATGVREGPVLEGAAKLKRIEAMAVELGIGLDKVVFYTDSHRDIDVLESVGFPCVVSPTRFLKRIARNKGWPILNHHHKIGRVRGESSR